MANFKNITGLRSGRLVAYKRHSSKYWLCQCDCSNTKIVRTDHLISGTIKSCGCICKERPNSTTHSLTRTRTYTTWSSMLARCNNKNNKEYFRYGGRGVCVCKSWHDFNNFFADMGLKPDGMTLDRIKNDKGYSPDNCRWATHSQQATNRRTTNFITHNGKTLCHKQWSLQLGGSWSLVQHRINRGWSDERAVTTPRRGS